MKLLAVIDFSETTENLVQKVEEVAHSLSAEVWLLHVAEPKPSFVGYQIGPKYMRDARSEMYHGEHRRIQEIADRLRSAGLDATALLVQGATVDTILTEAAKLGVDMIVLGLHGRGIMHRLGEGDVTEGVLRKSVCPVFVVPSNEHVDASLSLSKSDIGSNVPCL